MFFLDFQNSSAVCLKSFLSQENNIFYLPSLSVFSSSSSFYQP
jgi:hypothetical protein